MAKILLQSDIAGLCDRNRDDGSNFAHTGEDEPPIDPVGRCISSSRRRLFYGKTAAACLLTSSL
jgi:hypothetical protein